MNGVRAKRISCLKHHLQLASVSLYTIYICYKTQRALHITPKLAAQFYFPQPSSTIFSVALALPLPVEKIFPISHFHTHCNRRRWRRETCRNFLIEFPPCAAANEIMCASCQRRVNRDKFQA